jgi:hypothetical protein
MDDVFAPHGNAEYGRRIGIVGGTSVSAPVQPEPGVLLQACADMDEAGVVPAGFSIPFFA